jgi:hypothetical protein
MPMIFHTFVSENFSHYIYIWLIDTKLSLALRRFLTNLLYPGISFVPSATVGNLPNEFS